ncbi:MAG: nucleotidyltransferase family protein [Bacillota bacterium]|nr:nucleotidyltransferase family protein [Bacillota bacterium]MDI7249532.1 nucleotidyltransferase family protein [Bacillota bacterium]
MAGGLVLAGATNRGRLRQVSDVPFEALIPVGGRALVDYVVEALAGCAQLERVVVVGPAELSYLQRPPRVALVETADGLVDNLARGLRELPADEHVLVATGDIPLITPAVVEGFLAECRALGDYDFYYAVIPRDVILSRYPGARRSWIGLRDQPVTGGNMFLLRPRAALAILPLLRRVTDLRKSPLGLASMLGPVLVCKYLLGRLTLGEAERRVQSYFHIKGRAVVTRHPEVGVDVDKPADLELVTSILSSGSS